MKRLILISLLLFPIATLNAQQDVPRKFSAFIAGAVSSDIPAGLPGIIDWFVWNEERWSRDKKVTVTYNTSGYPVTRIYDLVSGSDLRYTYTYNENNQITEMLIQQREVQGGLWVNSTRLTQEFDEKGNGTLRLNESYISGVWMIQSGIKTEWEYKDNLVYRETISFFDPSNGSFYFFWRFTYSYQDGIRTGYVNEAYRTDSWVNYFKAIQYFDSQGRPDYTLFDDWMDSLWVTDGMERYFFSGEKNNVLITYQYYPETSLYVPIARYTYEYDTHQSQTLATTEAWLNGNWYITDGNRCTITYDGLHAITRITETWIAEQEATAAHWENSTKEEFSDFQSSGVEVLAAPKIEFKCFPNPADEFIWVTIGNGEPVDGFLELTDLTGKTLIRRLCNSSIGTLRINLNEIPRGLYKLVFRNQVQQPVAVSVIVH
jgi:hypothetical protein